MSASVLRRCPIERRSHFDPATGQYVGYASGSCAFASAVVTACGSRSAEAAATARTSNSSTSLRRRSPVACSTQISTSAGSPPAVRRFRRRCPGVGVVASLLTRRNYPTPMGRSTLARMPQADAYSINAAELARRLKVNGKHLRDVLRAHPELVPGHLPNEHYRIDRQTEQRIRQHPEVRVLKHPAP